MFAIYEVKSHMVKVIWSNGHMVKVDMVKVNDRTSKTGVTIFLKLTIKAPE